MEADECGALSEWLELAPRAEPVCSHVAAMVFTRDVTDRPVRALADGQGIDLGSHRVTWFDAPHVPHGWDCGYLGENTTRTLLCSDLFTQAGADNPPLTERDVLGPSEGMRKMMDYFSHGKDTRRHIEKLAAFEPRVLACMHGSAFAETGAPSCSGSRPR